MPVVDAGTQYLSLPLPSLANDTVDDCLRIIAALEALDAKAEGVGRRLASADRPGVWMWWAAGFAGRKRFRPGRMQLRNLQLRRMRKRRRCICAAAGADRDFA
jgi:hypothetical protein